VNYSLTASRLAIGTCGVVVGAYCAFTAFRNGQTLAAGIDGIAFGSAFASVVVGSWFLLPLAAHSPRGRAALMRLGWALCLAFVLINAVGFTANHRTAVVGGKANTIVAYDVALSGLKAAQDAIAEMKVNPRWGKTAGCTDVTVPQSAEFCGTVQAAQAELARARTVVASGKPAVADAQADTIAWATRIDSTVVARALPIFMAIVLDIAASLFIWTALTVYLPAKAKTRKRAPAKPKAMTARPKRWTKKQTQQLFAAALKRPDRRRTKARNDNVVMQAAND
jgi:hypothetical protein